MEEASGSGETFTEDQMTDFQCPVCLEVPRQPPVYQCKNGHCVCRGCHEQLTNCPVCRVSLGNIRCLIFEKSLENAKHSAAAQKKLRCQVSLANNKLEQVLTEHHVNLRKKRKLRQANWALVATIIDQLATAKDMLVAFQHRQEATDATQQRLLAKFLVKLDTEEKLQSQLSTANDKLVTHKHRQKAMEETLEQVLAKYHVNVKNESKLRHQLSMAKEKPVARKYRQETTEETLHYEQHRWTRIALTILFGSGLFLSWIVHDRFG